MSDAVQSEQVANMAKGWVRAPLSRFLTPDVETVDVQAEQTYPTVGVLNVNIQVLACGLDRILVAARV